MCNNRGAIAIVLAGLHRNAAADRRLVLLAIEGMNLRAGQNLGIALRLKHADCRRRYREEGTRPGREDDVSNKAGDRSISVLADSAEIAGAKAFWPDAGGKQLIADRQRPGRDLENLDVDDDSALFLSMSIISCTSWSSVGVP